MKTYDAVIIGSGQAGNPVASALAEAGRSVAIIEREHVGGTCVNVGCTPTKTLVASARVAHLVRRAAEYGVEVGSLGIDWPTIRGRKEAVVSRFRSGNQSSLEENEQIDLLFGEARFTGPKTILVQPTTRTESTRQEPFEIGGELIFINTGGRPAVPSIPGIESVTVLNSTTIMELDALPEHLLVIGGGYVGLEFGQMFRRFGCQVTVIQRGEHLLAREDEDVSDEVAAILREDGIRVLLNATATKAGAADDGAIQLTVQVGEGDERTETVSGSHLLIAAGRTPNTDMLNLDAAGVQTDGRGFVQVNERLETSAPGIYALGDVKGGPAFTHISYDDFRVVRDNLLDGDGADSPHTIRDRLVPYTVFIDPQLGRVGLSESEAREQGLAIQVAKLPMSSVARAIETDETRGFMKAVVDAQTDQILGCAILGIEGGEIMSVLQMAMMGNVPYTAIRDGTFAHPTLSESLNSLFGTI